LYRQKDTVTNPTVDIKQIYIGSEMAYEENKTFNIFSPDGDTYKIGETETITKRIGLRWINKTDLNEYIGFSDGIADIVVGENKEKIILPYDEYNYIKQK